jgi:hypothetical protein
MDEPLEHVDVHLPDTYLICADVDETLDAPHDARSFQQHMRAEDVVHGEVKAVPERIVHVRLNRSQNSTPRFR